MRWVVRAVSIASCVALGFAARWPPIVAPIRGWISPPVADFRPDLPEGTCVADLLVATVALQRLTAELAGVPVEFPANLEVQPEAVALEIDALRAACPDQVMHASCDEYPCLAIARGFCGASKGLGWTWVMDNEPRDLLLSDGSRATFTLVARYEDDEGVALMMPVGADQRNQLRRLQTRAAQAMDALANELGARPLTERERAVLALESKRESARAAEAAGFDEWMLDALRDGIAVQEGYLATLPEDP